MLENKRRQISTASLRVLRVLATAADSGRDARLGYCSNGSTSWLLLRILRVLGILGRLAPLLLAPRNPWNSPLLLSPLLGCPGGLLLLLAPLLTPLLAPLLLHWRPWVEAPLPALPGFLNFLGCRN